MTDEEKQAIERIEQFIDGERQYNTKTGETIIPYEYGESQRFVYKETYYAIQVVLNLIEKQQREIEKNAQKLKELNIDFDTLVAEFERLEDLEDRIVCTYVSKNKVLAIFKKYGLDEKECFFSSTSDIIKFVEDMRKLMEIGE